MAVGEDGAVRIGAQTMPFTSYASAEARKAFALELPRGEGHLGADLLTLREYYTRFNDALLARVRERYPADVAADRIGGVKVFRVRPAGSHGRLPVLINLHGGGFAWGSGSGALVEALPLACRMGAEVVAVDYRMAPEHQFPAASEDVAAVYSTLLETHPAETLGMFGCSAGAILATQALAWFRRVGLPFPGALALLSGAGLEPEGDSGWLAPPLCGEPLLGPERDGAASPLRFQFLPYLSAADPGDPLAFPVQDAGLLNGFPPTLLLSGSRDFAASSLSWLHRRLLASGVDARLVLFDGLWHAFHVHPELPESVEAHDLMAGFFRRALAPIPQEVRSR